MRKISCEITNLSQRFEHFYLFRELSLKIETGEVNIIKGSNGSGKSTFLKILSGGMEAWSGETHFLLEGEKLKQENLWQNVSFVAPYQELPEELTLKELIDFQRKTKYQKQIRENYQELMERFEMTKTGNKPISQFSTGMKQKAKIVLALGEKRPIWILDEPNSNLDSQSSDLLWDWLISHKNEHLIAVASNDPKEIEMGKLVLDMEKGISQI